MDTNNNDLINIQEVADMLSVGKSKIRDYVRKGYIKHIKLGHRTLRFSRADIQEFIRLNLKQGGK